MAAASRSSTPAWCVLLSSPAAPAAPEVPGHFDAPLTRSAPCLQSTQPYAKQPWCDHTKSIEERAADAVSRLTLPEKICSLDTSGCPNPSLGLPDYNWWSEASSGVSNSHEATKFPFPITTGMSFNKTMWHSVGHAIGHEARALMNAGLAQSTYWAPVVNLAREPRWGRNIEVPGEDPYQSGE